MSLSSKGIFLSDNGGRMVACLVILAPKHESTARQYRLVERATRLGWRADQVHTIDDDQGLSGSGTAHRKGFELIASEVALGRVGLILAIEVSRLAS
jgi:DNA invertase Pin-like site-specific DNA recombinase